MTVRKSSLLQSNLGFWKIGAPEHNIHVLSFAHRSLVHARNPCSNSVVSYYCIRNVGIFQRVRGSKKALPNSFNCAPHAFPGNVRVWSEDHF
ncbi:hypothetical protein D3C83_76020 [compost metagenome]